MLKINLLSSSKISNLNLLRVLLVAFALTLVLYYALSITNYQLSTTLLQNQEPLLNTDTRAWHDEYSFLQKELKDIDKKLLELKNDLDPIKILHQIITLLPETIWLTKIQNSSGGKILLEGESIKDEQLTIWIATLKQTSGIDSVELKNVWRDITTHFTINIEYGGE